MAKMCSHCKTSPRQKHFNSKYCKPCASFLRRRPNGTLTPAQKRWIKGRIGQIPVTEMAKRLGTSVANIKRSMRGTPIWFHNGKYKNQPTLVRRVITYYEKNGKSATVKAFPGISVKSIIDRPTYYGVEMKPRQVRWQEKEIIMAAKMAGLVDGETQARIFNRPGANEGSIKSLWMKRFGISGGNIHGMSEWMAKQVLKPGYPVLKTRVWSPRKRSRSKRGPVRGLVLWCEMEPYLLQGTPRFIREGVRAMAQFQSWLFKSDDPKQEILRLCEITPESRNKQERVNGEI